MKIKCRPEDFCVEELIDLSPSAGPFALYELRKRSLTTYEALDRVRNRWRLDHHRIAFAGLKDKYAETTQFVTIRDGEQRNLKFMGLEFRYCGQVSRAIESSDICGNRFRLVVRSLAEADIRAFQQNLVQLQCDGMPNYFDDQRFGSLGESGEFAAVAWCRGDYERALWLSIADANEHDRGDSLNEKRLFRERWGDWQYCYQQLSGSMTRPILQHLRAHPTDFRFALTRIRPEIRSLYLAAFQSFVWNQMLDQYLVQLLSPDQLFGYQRKGGRVTFYRQLSVSQREELERLRIPLPSARSKNAMGTFGSIAESILSEFGLSLQTMRLRYPRDTFFSKGDRQAIVFLGDESHFESEDELYPGQRCLTWCFELPRGSYATVAVKRCFAETTDSP